MRSLGRSIGLARARASGVLWIALLLTASVAVGDGRAQQQQQQQPSRGILAPGDAAVAGFSGVRVPVRIAKGEDPAEQTFIDLDGPSLRFLDLERMGGPLDARLVPAPKPVTIVAGQIGQVFSIALDNRTPPNVYVAASSAYGLPIAAPSPRDGALRHVRKGRPGATFMPGLWGGADPKGGPGSIWRIDGVTGAVRLFANLGDAGNSGAALGGLAYDPDSTTLLAVDRETGIIHRMALDGSEWSRYDHGVEGRRAAGLAPVPYDAGRRLDVSSAAFDSERPATWGLAPPERRVFGIGVHDGRLYYAVADGLQIWSFALFRDAERRDPRFEFAIPPAAAPTEISKILFDDAGRMILAERPAPTGAFDFNTLAVPNVGRVLRYALVASVPGAPRVWQPDPADYAIGFPEHLTNANGGAAIGFPYDAEGFRDRSTCGGFLWSTGEELRRSDDRALEARLGLAGPAAVNGLQGNPLSMLRPRNEPPLSTYFIDYDDRLDETIVSGHLGDVAIWRPCGPSVAGRWQMPGWMLGWSWWGEGGPVPPAPGHSCPADQQKPGITCCPKGTAPDEAGACKPWCPNGAMDLDSQKLCGLGFDNATHDPSKPGDLACLGGASPKPGLGLVACIEHSPVFGTPVCAAGFAKKPVAGNMSVCAPTPQQSACPPGQQVSPIDGGCHALCAGGIAWPGRQCCAEGSAVSAAGKCCPAGAKVDPATGQCQQQVAMPACPPGTKPGAANPGCVSTGDACPEGSKADPKSGACLKEIGFCVGGGKPDPATGKCPPGSAPPPSGCPVGLVAASPGAACCPQGQAPGAKGQCTIASCPAPAKLVAGTCCTADQLAPGGACAAKVCGKSKSLLQPDGVCCAEADVYKDASGAAACCTTGAVVDGKCTKPPLTGIPADPTCGSGYQPASDGVCCLASQLTAGGQCCPADQSPSGPAKTNCAATHTAGPPATPPSGNGGSTGKVCCASGSVPVAAGGCCALAQLTGTGVCCPAGQTPDPKRPGRCGAPTGTPVLVKETPPQPACAAGFSEMPDGSCCKTSNLSKDGLRCMAQSGKETVAPAGPIPVPVPIPSRSKAAPGDDDDDDDDDRRTSARQKAPSGEARRDRQPERSRDSERREMPKAEPAKREPPKPEPQKSDPPRPDPVRREPPKPEPPKREVPKAEPPKREVPKVNKLVVPKVLKVVPANKKQETKPTTRPAQPNIR